MFEADPLSRWALFRDIGHVHWLSTNLGLPYLPWHLHEILISFLVYVAIYFLTGPVLRNWRPYKGLNASRRAGFASHVVSQVNAFILLAISYPLFNHPKLQSLVSYTPYSGFVAAVCSGYFLFDIFITLLWYKDNGLGFALHAVASFFVFMQGNRPFLHQYAAPYIWFEASTPFVNFHWLANNVPNVVSKQMETINGSLLIIVFFLCRVIAGPYNGYYLFKEALFTRLPGVPYWVVLVIFICYSVLSTLNFYWFGKMMNVAIEVLFKTKPFTEESVPLESQPPSDVASTPGTRTSGLRKRKI